MLIQLLTERPQAIVDILAGTPAWVWALLAGLVALGLSQLRDRTASMARVSVMPVAMTLFSLSGTLTDLRGSPLLPQALAAWATAACVLVLLVAPGRTTARYDAATRSFALPGSVVPLALILAIFLMKYAAGIELRLRPDLVQDRASMLAMAGAYGALSGMFVGRAARLWRLAFRRAAATPAAA